MQNLVNRNVLLKKKFDAAVIFVMYDHNKYILHYTELPTNLQIKKLETHARKKKVQFVY